MSRVKAKLVCESVRRGSILIGCDKMLDTIFNNRLSKFITINNVLFNGYYGDRKYNKCY